MNTVENINKNTKTAPVFNREDKVILVVEDDRTHRNLMEKILRECKFRTVPAENGLIALCKIDSGQKFDLIIMDWDMPELNGLETVKEIRGQERTQGKPHTPVIAFTAHRQPGDREKCIAAGMDAYLPKDVWMPKWRATLMDNLQGLIAGDFEVANFEEEGNTDTHRERHFDLEAFDMQTLEQAAALLKNELPIAIEEYLEDAAAYIQDIREGVENGDAEKAAHGSHPLKSNSKSFGLIAVSQIAEAINEISRKGSLDGVESYLAQLQDAFNNAEKKLQQAVKSAGF